MFEKRAIEGAWFALAAYGFWGIVPIYFKWVDHVDPLEILSHRVIWSVVLLLAILAITGQLPSLRIPPQRLWKLAVTAALLSANWLIFIFAVTNDNITATSLGYFINPLVSVLLGMIFLGERLRPLQWIAIMIAASGILFQLFWYGKLPWISLALAFSFGFYGLLRKNFNLPSIAGLAVETMIVCPLAMAFLIWLYTSDAMAFGTVNLTTDMLLIMGGVVTSFPLLCFAAAVTRLSLTAAGMFQYLAPSMSLVIAVAVYDEPFGIDRIITFSCIWVALAIFSVESINFHRKIHSRLEPGV
ncbi:MAG: EamA family transporter RarD [Pseudomonadales bacterium]|nr:EamA family transporter RarD [Pseudomonadales bacterium]